jgi:hypothetical protein
MLLPWELYRANYTFFYGLLLCEIGSFTKSGYLKEEKKHIKYFLIRNQRPILNQFKIK